MPIPDTSIGASLFQRLFGQTFTLSSEQSLVSASQSTLAILTSARPGKSLLARSSHTGASLWQWPHLRSRGRTAAPQLDRARRLKAAEGLDAEDRALPGSVELDEGDAGGDALLEAVRRQRQ